MSEFEWQPIETAPKDGTLIDVWAHGRRYPGVKWTYWEEDPEFQCWTIQHYFDASGSHHWEYPHIHPTHWAPLPPEPPLNTSNIERLLPQIYDDSRVRKVLGDPPKSR